LKEPGYEINVKGCMVLTIGYNLWDQSEDIVSAVA